jgi:DNA repair protein RadC
MSKHVIKLREQLAWYEGGLIATLSDGELLALVLGGGNPSERAYRLARRVLQRYSIRELRTIEPMVLCTEFRLSLLQARRLKMAYALAEHMARFDASARSLIRSADDAVQVLRPLMAHLDREEFRVLILSTKNEIVSNVLLYQGTVSSAAIRTAEILRQAIVRNCPAILVAHNHPSGNPTASPDDLTVTIQLVEAAHVMDIEVVDHLIIGAASFVSLRNQLKW